MTSSYSETPERRGHYTSQRQHQGLRPWAESNPEASADHLLPVGQQPQYTGENPRTTEASAVHLLTVGQQPQRKGSNPRTARTEYDNQKPHGELRTGTPATEQSRPATEQSQRAAAAAAHPHVRTQQSNISSKDLLRSAEVLAPHKILMALPQYEYQDLMNEKLNHEDETSPQRPGVSSTTRLVDQHQTSDPERNKPRHGSSKTSHGDVVHRGSHKYHDDIGGDHTTFHNDGTSVINTDCTTASVPPTPLASDPDPEQDTDDKDISAAGRVKRSDHVTNTDYTVSGSKDIIGDAIDMASHVPAVEYISRQHQVQYSTPDPGTDPGHKDLTTAGGGHHCAELIPKSHTGDDGITGHRNMENETAQCHATEASSTTRCRGPEKGSCLKHEPPDGNRAVANGII
jgi:hypothetical protein